MPPRGFKSPTTTFLVLEALVRADDFLTSLMLQRLTGRNMGQVSAALSHLRKHKAADFIASDEALWWFATPDIDDRSIVHKELMPGGTRRRKTGYKSPKTLPRVRKHKEPSK